MSIDTQRTYAYTAVGARAHARVRVLKGAVMYGGKRIAVGGGVAGVEMVCKERGRDAGGAGVSMEVPSVYDDAGRGVVSRVRRGERGDFFEVSCVSERVVEREPFLVGLWANGTEGVVVSLRVGVCGEGVCGEKGGFPRGVAIALGCVGGLFVVGGLCGGLLLKFGGGLKGGGSVEAWRSFDEESVSWRKGSAGSAHEEGGRMYRRPRVVDKGAAEEGGVEIGSGHGVRAEPKLDDSLTDT